MDLITINSEDLGSLRTNDYFYDPSTEKIYQYRNKEGKAIIVREVGTSTITKLFKNVLKTVLKVDGDFDKYQVISIDTSLTLFNANIGETFEIDFGDATNIDETKEAFNRGDEVVAEIFDYEDIKVCMKLSIATTAESSTTATESVDQELSKEELQRIKEIEEKKAKKRPFPSSESSTKPAKTKKTEPKAVKVSSKKAPSSKQETKPAPKEEKKEDKKEVKKETKQEKKEREKREKEEKKAREKAEKEAKKAREKAEKEAKKKKK